MREIISASILGGIAVTCFIISILQFFRKGFLFNNAYIFASKQEKETMKKEPYYIQSAIVFLLISGIFFANAFGLLFHADTLFGIAMATMVITLIFAIVSSVIIEKRNEKEEEEE